ncbi:MAG: sulfurtransferase TusA family protein [Cucumibacter sp.]
MTVLASDPMAKIDIPHLCQREGHRLLEMVEQDGLRFEIERA